MFKKLCFSNVVMVNPKCIKSYITFMVRVSLLLCDMVHLTLTVLIKPFGTSTFYSNKDNIQNYSIDYNISNCKLISVMNKPKLG